MMKKIAARRGLDYTEDAYPDVELIPLICAKFNHHSDEDRWIEISFAVGEPTIRHYSLSQQSIDLKYDKQAIIKQLKQHIEELEQSE